MIKLQNQNLNVSIVVVEQNGDAPFNRGKLFNIGQYFCYFITRISSY
ncbi:MAG: hypothetical protein ACK56F_13075 [bacterium]